MDGKVVAPYGLESDRKERDRQYIQALSGELLNEIYIALNAYHETNHEKRYWNILLGHWLQRFVSVTFNRYHCLEKALNKNSISGTYVIMQNEYSLATATSIDFQWALYDDRWNHHFYSRVMEFWHTKNRIPIEPENVKNCFAPEEGSLDNSSIKKKCRDAWSWVARIFVKERDALVIKSYLPTLLAAKLQLSMGQFPAFWADEQVEKMPSNSSLRRRFSLDVSAVTGFEYFLRKMVTETIPTCYLEGFQKLVERARSVPWPKKPKFIFTSNNFDTDEVFKIWTAQKVEEGHKYYIGQHGNLYGTWIYHSYDIPEFATPDKFISWGWTKDNLKIAPAYIFKTAGWKARKKFDGSTLLLIERCIYNRLASYDRHVNHAQYQEEQFRFVSSLTRDIRDKLLVRLAAHKLGRLSWSDEQRWQDFDANVRLDLGHTNSWKLIKKSRLVVHSYDSTGLLETLSLNIPTIGFWYNLYDELESNARGFYELLERAGILFRSPECAAKHVVSYWDNLSDWWSNNATQEARAIFCEQFARREEWPLLRLRRILTTDSRVIGHADSHYTNQSH